jgi:hypothetical protein
MRQPIAEPAEHAAWESSPAPVPMAPRWALMGLAALALVLLLLGTAVYVLDRPAATAALLPAAWERHVTGVTWFGGLGDWLPSLAHAFGFSIFTALVLPRSPRHAAWACGCWAVVDSLAEVGQHAAVSPALAAAVLGLQPAGADSRFLATVARYFAQGGFDTRDLVAGLSGAGLAYLGLHCVDSLSRPRRAELAKGFQGDR